MNPRKRVPGRLLTEAEVRERSTAGRASAEARARRAHQAQPGATPPSIHQGSTGEPSRRAVGLFRQGQQHRGSRGRGAVFDSRSTEPTVGSFNASFTLHFPKAYRSDRPDPVPRGRTSLAATLAPKKTGELQGLVVKNPQTIAEAHRHPMMREIITRSIGVVRDHQKGTIDRGYARKLIPEGTRPGLVSRAYKHAALLAIHKAGLGDYEFGPMDETAKAELRPLVPFMRYAHRRVFDQMHVANPGKFQPFKDEFGHLFEGKKDGKKTGATRMRMRPNNEFIKLDLGDLSEEAMEKSWTNATGTVRAPGSPTNQSRDGIGNSRKPLGRLGGGPRGQTENKENGHDTHSPMKLARVALARAQAAHGPQGRLMNRLKLAKPVPELPHGTPPIAGGDTHIKEAARQVEDHFGIPPIGGSAGLNKIDLGFMLGTTPPSSPRLGGYNTNPATQLKRAMHPRVRRQRFRLRLNTQRHLRSVLSGGITRQERWQLGATPRIPKSFYKRADPLVTKATAQYTPSGTPQEHCGKCAHFRPPHRCAEVRGTVIAAGWCNFFDARVAKRSPIDDAADKAAHPTDAQARAGNYAMGHASVGGLDVSIETPRGRIRRKVSRSGKAWSVRMPAHYGYIKRTEGADGDHVDVYLGPHAHQAEKHPVFVVDQQHADSKAFDEHKALLGFRDRDHATKTYDAAFSDKRGPDRRRAVHEVTFEDFKHWVGNGDTKKPYAVGGKINMRKGLVGDAVRYGATYLSPIARAAARSSTGTAVGSRIGNAARRAGQSRPAQAVANAAGKVAAHPRVAAVAGHPRVAPAIAEARELGGRGLLAPMHAAGRISGAAVAGERGARIGGGVGLAADYAPVAYTAAGAGQALFGGNKRDKKKPLPPARTLTQHATDQILGKGLLGAGFRAIGRSSTKTKVALAAGAGAAALPTVNAARDHPAARAAIGAGLAGGAAAAITRGRAIASVRGASRALYTTGLKDAVREHIRVLSGAAPSPHHVAQQHAVFRAVRARLAREAKAKRTAGIAAIRPARGTIGAVGAGGAVVSAAAGGRNRWDELQRPENP